MRHRNGRMIYGISYEALASGIRSRCNVTPVEGDRGDVNLCASGPQLGAPITPESLCDEDRARYDAWLASKANPA